MKRIKKFVLLLLALIIVVSCTSINSFAVSNKDRYSVLVLDVSGSMSGRPIEELKKGANAFCEQVLGSNRSNNKIAIVAFESSSDVLCEFTSDLSELKTAIGKLNASGGTNLSQGLSSAKNMLDSIDRDVIKNMVVMCDGEPDSAYSAYNVVKSMPLHWNVYGLYYCQDGFSSSAENVMKNVGRNGYYKVEDGSALTFSFIDNGTTITTKSVNNVVVRIACPVDVSVTLNNTTLDKFNTQTTFGKLEIENVNGEEIKTLVLAYRNDYVINIDGYDNGTMDYDIAYRCNDDELYSLSYPTTDITSSTHITTGIDIDNANMTLDVDKDGDGEVDNKVKPNASVSGFWYKIKTFLLELFYRIKDFFECIFKIGA